jgi:hypothetical protein
MEATKRRPQKVVITITDKDVDAGLIDVSITFKPTVKGNEKVTPAMSLALKFLELTRSRALKGSTAVSKRKKS